jgi:hypothetical protein
MWPISVPVRPSDVSANAAAYGLKLALCKCFLHSSLSSAHIAFASNDRAGSEALAFLSLLGDTSVTLWGERAKTHPL